MLSVKCDRKGRLYLKKAVRAQYGDRFAIILRPNALVLVPIPADPIADLRELGRPLRGKPLAELKARVRERARQEALA